ncbi:MAG: hypothetical protein K6G03_09875 [Lachnospiraceae bacterium]|nr:hypothetical protein [Lachnospiraceae bacterium]
MPKTEGIVMALFEKKFRFTSNKHSTKGLMALVFGTMSMVSFFLAVIITIGDKVQYAERMGSAGFLALIFSFIGIANGSSALSETDVFPVLPRVGFAVALISLLLWGGIIYVGFAGL